MNDDHACPDCGDDAVSREGTGVWLCESCGHKFAGGAYQPQTPGGRAAARSLRSALAEESGDDEDE
jgi:large subunit ribosomal protein L37Ae